MIDFSNPAHHILKVSKHDLLWLEVTFVNITIQCKRYLPPNFKVFQNMFYSQRSL